MDFITGGHVEVNLQNHLLFSCHWSFFDIKRRNRDHFVSSFTVKSMNISTLTVKSMNISTLTAQFISMVFQHIAEEKLSCGFL